MAFANLERSVIKFLLQTCEENETWKEKYCDKRHPMRCFFFDTYGRCNFGTFCSYWHKENIEIQLRKEIAKLRAEINKLKSKNKESSNRLESLKILEETS